MQTSLHLKMGQEAVSRMCGSTPKGGTQSEQVEISALDPKHSEFCLVGFGLLSSQSVA